MRKLFTLLTLCLLASAAWATDITFVAGVDNGTSPGTQGPFVIEKEGVKIDVESGLANDSQYRFYKNKNVTISTTLGVITKIVFECTANDAAQYGPGCFTATPETYTYSGKIGTWEGSSEQVVFTAATNQVRATKITVSISEAGLAAPSIKPAAGTYYNPIEVTITCGTSDAKIYYTTNGSNPTTSSTQYTAPFTLNSNTTVKAISAKDGDVSEVVVAEYVFGTAVSVNNIAEYQAAEVDEVLNFKNSVNVLAQHNSYLFVKDNTGYALFYGDCGQTYKNGDVIPAGFVGTRAFYNGEPELKDLSNFKPASSNSPIAPEMIGANQVTHDMFGHFVRLEHVTFSTTDNKNYTLIDEDGNECAVYFGTLNAKAPGNLDILYTVEAIVGSYGRDNVVYQLLPTLVKPEGDGGVGIGTMSLYDDNTQLVFDYDATVIFHGNSRLFVKDQTGFGLIYGNVGKTYKQGDVFSAGYSGKKTTYGGEPELASPFSDFNDPIKNETVNAEVATPLDVKHENFAHYVVMRNVDVTELSGNNFKVVDANGNTCNGYNQFAQDVKEGHYDELYGVVGSYGSTNTVYQLLPIIPSKPTPVKNINELYALDKGKQGQFTTPLTAIYQNEKSSYLYVQDAEGVQSLVYGGVSGPFTNGDLITNAIATWNEYQGAKQMIPVENFAPNGRGNKIEPDEPMPIEEISQDMVHRYLSFEDVDIITEEDKMYIVDETGQLHMFDKFEVGIKGNAPYYVEGFLTVYKGELEFYPILVQGEGGDDCGTKGDVNNDGEIGIADVNALLDIILGANVDDCTRWRADMNGDGEIGLADVNALTDYILGH